MGLDITVPMRKVSFNNGGTRRPWWPVLWICWTGDSLLPYCIAFGVAIRSCFLLHGESSSFKKSCPQGLPSNFWGKQKIFLGMLGFSVKKNQQNSVFHFFTSPFFPFCSWKDKEASMKKNPQSWWKMDSIWTMPTRVAKLAKVTKKSNPFFLNSNPIPSWTWIITFIWECLFKE